MPTTLSAFVHFFTCFYNKISSFESILGKVQTTISDYKIAPLDILESLLLYSSCMDPLSH